MLSGVHMLRTALESIPNCTILYNRQSLNMFSLGELDLLPVLPSYNESSQTRVSEVTIFFYAWRLIWHYSVMVYLGTSSGM